MKVMYTNPKIYSDEVKNRIRIFDGVFSMTFLWFFSRSCHHNRWGPLCWLDWDAGTAWTL